MFRIEAWENGVGYHIKCDPIMAETISDALTNALSSESGKGNAVGDIFEIDVEIDYEE